MAEQINVFLASPSDVSAEREAVGEALEEVNETIGRVLRARVCLYRWERDARPGFHPEGPQGLIESIIDIGTMDSVVGIFWTRYGTTGDRGRSNTHREVETAFQHWQEHGRPELFLYFKQAPYSPDEPQQLDQWKKVKGLQKNFEERGLCWNFTTALELQQLVRRHFSRFLKERMGDEVVEQRRQLCALEPPRFLDVIPRPSPLSAIQSLLKSAPVVSLEGLSGSGKTYLASQLAQDRNLVWYHGTPGDTLEQLSSALSPLHPGIRGSPRQVIQRLIRDDRPDAPLLVVDNFESVDSQSFQPLLEESRASGRPGALLLLSQSYVDKPVHGAGIEHYHLGSLDKIESRELLERLGVALDDSDLTELLAQTGGLPLAVSFFGRLVKDMGFPPKHLLEGRLARQARLKEWYRNCIGKLSPHASDLLEYLSLSEVPFDLSLMRTAAFRLVSCGEEAFQELLTSRLVGEYSECRWRVHDLVRGLALDSVDPRARLQGHRVLGDHHAGGYSLDPNLIVDDYEFKDKERACHHYIEGECCLEAAAVLRSIGKTAKLRSHYETVITLGRRLIARDRGLDPWLIYDVAHCEFIIGSWTSAADLVDSIRSARRGDPNLAVCVARLEAELLATRGRASEAHDLLGKRLAEVRWAELTHTVLHQARSVEVWLLERQGRIEEAEQLAEELLADATKSGEKMSAAVAFARRAALCCKRERHTDSETNFSHAIGLFQDEQALRAVNWVLRDRGLCRLLHRNDRNGEEDLFEALRALRESGECTIDYSEALEAIDGRVPEILQRLVTEERSRLVKKGW